ncbi:hypothetical protein DPMN_140731 [Dreissena polymorpha]|uniref:Uncharacterized protein n=1 Tax=Dreissena polymorpha TaxID=45954 RepID=A0A9D4G894_DREPO|nr:hypothetical protein DPMN_140731 [Dreissena polymorpha]
MKNLKLRSSLCEGLSNKIVNDCADKDCGISSTDMDDVDMKTEGEGTDYVWEEIVIFKRVSSLQDLRLSAKVKACQKLRANKIYCGTAMLTRTVILIILLLLV